MKLWLAASLALTVVACSPRSDDRDLSRAASRDVPAAAAVALLVFKLSSRKASFTWGAYATAVATLAAMSWANMRFVINALGSV